MKDIQLLNRFVRTYESPQTRRAYESDLLAVISRLKPTITTATPADVRNAFLQATRGLGGSSRYRRLSALRSFSQWLLSMGIVQSDLTTDLRDILLAPESRTAEFPLSASEVDLILECNSGRASKSRYRNNALFAIAVDSGLQRAELVAMNLEHIEYSIGEFALRVFSRAGLESRLYLSPWSSRFLLQWIESLETSAGPIWTSLSNNSKGERLTAESVYRVIRSMTERARLGRVVTPETLRLTAFYRRFSKVTDEATWTDSSTDIAAFRRKL